jgi:hypothetical protein
MKVRLEDPEAALDLGEFLRTRIGAIVEQTGRGELEVSLLGSYNEAAMRDQLSVACRRWAMAARQHDTPFEIGE